MTDKTSTDCITSGSTYIEDDGAMRIDNGENTFSLNHMVLDSE